MRRLLSPNVTNVLFIAGLILLTVISFITYRQIQKLVSANDMVSHTYEVIDKTNRILISILHIDAHIQNFSTQKEKHNFPAMMTLTLMEVQNLRAMTLDNKEQQRRLDVLEPLIKQKMTVLQEILKSSKNHMLISMTETQTNKLLQIADDFKNEELRLLKERDLRSTKEVTLTHIMILVLVIVGDLLLLLTFFLIHKQNKQLREAERNQAELANRYTRMIDSSKDLIAAIDKDYNFIAFNDAYAQKFYQLLGVHIQMGISLKEVLRTYPDRETILAAWERALLGEEFVINIPLGSKNSHEKFYEVSFNSIRDKSNSLIAATHIMRDVTARMEVDHLKSEFVSIVSHELRTPLTAIRGSISLILGGTLGKLNEAMQKLLTIASNNCDKLIFLINDLLDIEKLEKGKLQFNLKLVDMNEIAEDAVLANRSYAENFSVHLDLEKNLTPLIAEIDPQRIRQVLDNFISNAIKFSHEGGKVKISVSLRENCIRVAVVDHGEGVPEAFKSIIFQKFAQADSSATRQRGGTGLGLSLGKAIIEKHHGRVGYTSTPGLETVFYFEIPVYNSANREEESG